MAADVFSFYTVTAMGLFTVLSIIVGYLLLNNAIVSSSRGSAYYAYTRISDSISNSMYSGVSSISNINLYRRYVLFSAYFNSEDDINYDVMEGFKIFSYGINEENFNGQILKDINKSSTGYSYSNSQDENRKELKKCVGDVCLCFGEMEVPLKLEPEYFNPLACVDICWGEYPGEYPSFLTKDLSRISINIANEQVSTNHPASKCSECVNYMKSTNNYFRLKYQGLNSIVTKYTPSEDNSYNYLSLEEFSRITKFSFIPNVIECRTMTELASKSGKKASNNAPHLFLLEFNSTSKGLFTLITPESNNLLVKILSLEYSYDNINVMNESVVKTSFIKIESLNDDSIFGAD